MARPLYRSYLYTVTLGMLIFAAVGLFLVLDVLLQQTALRGSFAVPPTRNDIVQRLTFGVVAWLIAAGLGGLHYSLIRRDMQADCKAGEGSVRAFFLNAAEAIAALVVVNLAVNVASQLVFGMSAGGGVATPLANAIAALAVTTALERERRRVHPAAGAALVFQRLHEYGVPLIFLLFTATSVWQQAIYDTTLRLTGGAESAYQCSPYGTCTPPNYPVFFWIAALLVSSAWAWYALLVRRDAHSGIRQVLHLAGFLYGIIWLTIGVQRGLELALRSGFNLTLRTPSIADMAAALSFGALVTLAYGIWLRSEADDLPMGAGAVGLSAEAITSAVLAVPCWWGVALTARYLIETNVPAGASLARDDLALALALLFTGVLYAAPAWDLLRRTVAEQIMGPRRALVLALLAAGTITSAVGAAITLYSLGTNLLGSPLTNWQEAARTGAVTLVTGAALAGLYVWRAMREHAFGPIHLHPAPATSPAATPAPPHDAIDDVLDEFAAGRLTHDDAADRLRELTHTH
jgi:hypothetical protein